MRVVRTQNKELFNTLKKLTDSSVAVGFFPESQYDDGTPVAEIASIHEYGAVINRVGSKVGAYQIRIPNRSFMRTTIHEKEQSWIDACIALIKSGASTADLMTQMGTKIAGDVSDKIRSIAAAGGNAPSVVKRKGFDAPLIDTGNMLRSVSFKIGSAA